LKAVLDESVPRRLARVLKDQGLDVSTFPRLWKGLKNGQLLARIEEEGFACLVTCDKSMRFQQNLGLAKIGVVVLPAQRFEDLVPIISDIVEALRAVPTGSALAVERSR
jgi:hypothetical protein